MVLHPPSEEKVDHVYDMRLLNLIFGVSCIVLLLSFIWLIADDSNRSWKRYQAQFERIEVERLKKEIAESQGRLDKTQIEKLKAELVEASAALEREHAAYQKAEKELGQARKRENRAQSRMQTLKSRFDARKYQYELLLEHDERKASHFKSKLDSLERKLDEAALAFLDATEARKSAEKRSASFKAKHDEIRQKISETTTAIDRLAEQKKMLEPGFVKAFRNFSLVSFIKPTREIKQIVVSDLADDYNFAKVEKVDRCISCHVSIDNEKYVDAPQPFKAHPKLGIYVGEGSSHPKNEFGCTTCHAGVGQALDFVRAAHTPDSPEQAKEWEKKHHWHRIAEYHWQWPMHSKSNIQASCYKCHSSQVDIVSADHLNLGKDLFKNYGCHGCHKMSGFEALRKVGPPLDHLKGKLAREWLFKWIENPMNFNPLTKMPRFFHLSNTDSPEDHARSTVEIHSIVSYLMTMSKKFTPRHSVAALGSVQRGKDLVHSIGCLGCHSLAVEGKTANDFAPDLGGIGSKVAKEWLVDWLLEPQHYFPKSRMPGLRLSASEAADISAYLLSLRVKEFEKQQIPLLDESLLRNLAAEHLDGTISKAKVEQALAGMTKEDRLFLVGQKSFIRYGCYGCHDIAGFEDAKPIGTEFTEEGSKPVEQFDFGALPIAHTREAFFAQKLKDPRSFDFKRYRKPKDKLRMPKFNFNETQISALTTFLSSLTNEKVAASKSRNLSPADLQIERGRFLVKNYNCIGCHVIEEKGGHIKAYYENSAMAPPELWHEGFKVKPNWLFDFFYHVKMLRPWLKVRMPSFNFTDEEVNDLVKYFVALDHQPFPFETEKPRPLTPQQKGEAVQLFEILKCQQCHPSGAEAEGVQASSTLGPNLAMARERLRRAWMIDWLKDPQKLQPGTMMPGFFVEGSTPVPHLLNGDPQLQIEALTDYLQTLH
ncbi:MAG: c-type cytochrome [Deltaproteobacteria bacterium]|nr:c-type cytochrome [Deltaproteobacteria bacterium]